ncbi:Uncharacterised protein [Segatella copri]|nr:Uncharacterised protein [Segatella copri]
MLHPVANHIRINRFPSEGFRQVPSILLKEFQIFAIVFYRSLRPVQFRAQISQELIYTQHNVVPFLFRQRSYENYFKLPNFLRIFYLYSSFARNCCT